MSAAQIESCKRAHYARLALARCGDLRPLDQPGCLTAQVAAELLTHHRGKALARLLPALPDLIACGDAALLAALGLDLAAAHLPQLKRALREHPTEVAVRLLGDLGSSRTDAETADLLAAVDQAAWIGVRSHAVTSWALITGDIGRGIEILRELLAVEDIFFHTVAAIGRLGPLGAPLLPEITALLNGRSGSGRSRAADAHWRITRSPEAVLPLVLARADAGVRYAPEDSGWYDRRRALGLLADMSAAGVLTTLPALPARLRPLVEMCAHSTRRVARGEDDELRRHACTVLGETGRAPAI